jgi:tRNA-dihydrouridine synthase
MVKAVRIPVTVKMRKGWDETALNAPDLARRVEDAGAAAVAIHGRTAKQSYSGSADWDFVASVAGALTIPVFGSGDCIEPEQIVERLGHVSGVYVGRGVLRNPWILAQAQDLIEGRPQRSVSLEERGRFLLDYIDLLMQERVKDAARHDRWVVNKLRALCTWFSKGHEGGSNLRVRVNAASSLAELRAIIQEHFALHD